MKIFFAIVLNILCVIPAFSQAENRWWNEENASTLNVIKDLKQGSGRIWYVDGVNGNDKTGDGTSLKHAWKTIGAAFDYYANRPAPGDTIIIGGGTYNERLSIRSKGTKDNPILIGPRGNGKVVIDASKKISRWTIYKGNVYKATCSFEPTAVVLDEQPLFPEFSLKNIGESKWYYDSTTKLLYLYAPGGGNPASRDIGVISNDQDQIGVFLNHTEHVTLYGLTVKYAGGYGISVLGSYNRIEKCNIKFNGKGGISIWPYADTISTNNIVLKNHIYHNMLKNWPRGRYKWGYWAAGAGGRAPNTQYIGNIVHKNGGEGLLNHSSKGGTIFRDNIVYDNWSVNIYVDNEPNCIIDRNLVFCHNPDPKDLYNNGDQNPSDNKNFRRLRADGIMTADENYDRTPPANFRNAKIVNNIIIGCRRGINHYGQASGSGLKNVLVANNTIIVPNSKGLGENFVGINAPHNNGNNINAVFRNNIVYASHPNTYLLYIDTNPLRFNQEFYGLMFDHNVWYHSSNPEPFHLGPTGHSSFDINFKVWAMKSKLAGQEAGSMFRNPNFIDAGQYSADAVQLRPKSPAIDNGLSLQEVMVDYFGNPRSDKAPDIGAIEFISTDTAMTQKSHRTLTKE